jgi:hypothetical protein
MFNYGNSLYVTQWDGEKQINYSFHDWQEELLINTQLDNLEQMCWLIANKNARTDDARTDDENINYTTERTQENGLYS